MRRSLRLRLLLAAALASLPVGLASAGQADKIVFIYGSSNARGVPIFLVTVNPDGSERNPIAGGPSYGSPEWSPDRSQIVFASYVANAGPDGVGGPCVWVVNADGTGARRVTRGPCYDSAPAWSPEGRQIAFTRSRGSGQQLYVIGADGSGLRRLSGRVAAGGADASQGWSPDGKRILFVRTRVAGPWLAGELFTVRPDGKDPRLLYRPPRGSIVSQADWHAGGRIALVLERRDGREILATIGADGKGLKELVRFPARKNERVAGLAWSPDGSRIAYCYLVSSPAELDESSRVILVVSADGGPPELLFDGCQPDW